MREASSGARVQMLHWQMRSGRLRCMWLHGMGMLMSSAPCWLRAPPSTRRDLKERRPLLLAADGGHIEVWTSCKAVAS